MEAYICEKRGISEPDIMVFDIAFEKIPGNENKQPGDDKAAPYRKEHCLAENIERLYAAELGVLWSDYN